MNKYTTLLCFILLLGLTSHSYARESISCGSTWIKRGATQYDVEKECGQPSAAYDWQEVETLAYPHRRYNNSYYRSNIDGTTVISKAPAKREIIVNFSRWTYDRGSSRLTKELIFRNGILFRIETGGYGG